MLESLLTTVKRDGNIYENECSRKPQLTAVKSRESEPVSGIQLDNIEFYLAFLIDSYAC